MDWNLKTPTWDFTQLEQDAFKSINTIGASSNFGGEERTLTRDFSVDLKLGQLGDLGTEYAVNEPGVSKTASSPSGSSKRARGSGNGAQPVSCLVDGCVSDLSNCRDYHRRHKVCELHSKTPQVTIGGQKQRFCQQCSRFHSLDEFDEGKRSCRKRLDGHNRRRRKPQPESLSRIGSILSHYQGSQLLPFSTPHVYPSTIVRSHCWAGIGNGEADSRLYGQQEAVHFPDKPNIYLGSSSNTSSYKTGKQLTFLQSDPMDASVCQPLLSTTSFSEDGGNRNRMLYDRFTNPVDESDCALSLLSSLQTQSSGMGLSQVEQDRNLISFLQPLGHNSLEPVDSVLNGSVSNADINCPGMFHVASDDGGSEAAPSLPFHWE